MSDKYAKYLRAFPQIKQCVVRLELDPNIQEKVVRRSVRLINLNSSTSAPIADSSIVVTPVRRSVRRLSMVNGSPNVPMTPVRRFSARRLSLGNRSPNKPKSILASASRLRGRSKSVTFDVRRADDVLTNEVTLQSPMSQAPLDLTTKIMQQPETAASQPRGEILIQVSTSSIATAPTESASSSGDKLAYENRIASLVESNKAKIIRIKDLLGERAQLSEQVENLHRINFSLAETVDLYRADENNVPSANDARMEIEQLNDENGALRGRVERLTKENDALKSYFKTHSKQVLSEHNYNLL